MQLSLLESVEPEITIRPGPIEDLARHRLPMYHVHQLTPELTFASAFAVWIGNRTIETDGFETSVGYISERTEWDYRQYARALEKFFGGLRLADIHWGYIHAYHRARALCDGPWERRAGANRIRKEIWMLVSIMKTAGAWTAELQRYFKRVRAVNKDVDRALTPEQQRHFLDVAASCPEWAYIYHYFRFGLRTTAATNELRGILLSDLRLGQRVVVVREAKNKYRKRTIPLDTEEVRISAEHLLERARALGARAPHHFLFPFRLKRNLYDPCRPMSDSGLKKSWDEVRIAAGLPWFRPYDVRHTGISRMAEAGAPIPVIMAFAGHMSRRMQEHYTSISMMSKRRWAMATWEFEQEEFGASPPLRKRA